MNITERSSSTHLTFLFVMVLLTILAYSNSLQGDFVWDDIYLVKENPDLRTPAALPRLFVSQFRISADETTPFYRPVAMVSFLLDYQIWKLNPYGYHLTNLLLHLATTVLFYLVGRKLFSDTAVIVATFIFALHPIHTESVSFISGRTDVLCAMFYLAALWLYLTEKHKMLCRSAAVLCFAAALLAKEMAVTLPVILVALDLWVKGEKPSVRQVSRYLPYVAVIMLYFVIRKTALAGQSLPLPSEAAFLFGLKTAPLMIIKYLGVLIFPWTLNSFYVVDTRLGLTDPVVLAGWVVILGLVVTIIIFRKKAAWCFSAFCFLATLLPVLNLLHVGSVPMAERFAYIPSMGFAWFLGLAFKQGLESDRDAWKYGTAAVLATLCLFYSGRTFVRNMDWRNDFVLYVRMVDTSPNSAVAHFNLGCVYRDQKDYQLAHRHWQEAARLNPRHAGAHNNLGALYDIYGLKDQALAEYSRTLEINPNNPIAWFNIGRIYEARGQRDEAGRYYERSRQLTR